MTTVEPEARRALNRLNRARGEELQKVLLDFMASASWDAVERRDEDATFNELALRIFRYQVEAVPVYGAMVANRGLDPQEVDDWRRIPPVPARAFRRFPLVAGGGEESPAATFRTSGTTGGAEARGLHRVLDLSLYHASLLPGARRHLNPDQRTLRSILLTPPPQLRPDSSLIHMLGVLYREWDDGAGGFFADAEWRLDRSALLAALADAQASGAPVFMAGTAFGYVHLLDLLEVEGLTFSLPAGSRLMETGGFKGRSREVARETLYRKLRQALGVPTSRIVNEYGMTEMLSQFWETSLAAPDSPGAEEPEERSLVGPPWVRTRILDPRDLSEVEPGGVGLLQHLDLANLHSVSAILTEDRGVEVGGGRFRVLGRRPGAEPRGCSLSMEELDRAWSGPDAGVPVD